MKSHFSHVVLIAGLTLFGSLSLNAQTKASATVPFIFQANHYAFSPGDYTLELAGANTDGRFQLTERSTGHSIFVSIAIPKGKKNYEEGHLTFACNDGDCVLAQVAVPNSYLLYARSDSAIDKDMDRKLGMATMVNVKLTK